MTADTHGPSNVLGTRDVFEAVIRLESTVASRMNALDSKVDAIGSRQDRLEGRLDALTGIIKWLGLPGLLGILGYLLLTTGDLRLP